MPTVPRKLKVLSFVLLCIVIPVFFAGLFFATRVHPVVSAGMIDLSETENKTVYLFGEWRLYESYAEPGSSAFDNAPLHTINTNKLPDTVRRYSLQATVSGLDTASYCLLLHNANDIDRIFINDTQVYTGTDPAGLSRNTIALDDLDKNAPFTITIWMAGTGGKRGKVSPLTLLLTPTDNASILSLVRIICKYMLMGGYFAFALICLMMYAKNKKAAHFLLLALSGLIRMLALESYLTPPLLAEWINLSETWSIRLSMLCIALASTLNVGVIYALYKKHVFKRITLGLLIVANVLLLMSFVWDGVLTLLLNIAGNGLYVLCLIAVGRAWLAGEKSAGAMFTAFLAYMISLPFFYGTRMLAGMGSALGVYNFICPLGEFVFFAVTIYAFFVRYIESYARSISRIRTLDSQLSDTERSLRAAYDKLRLFEAARTRMLRDLTHDLRTPVTSVLGYLSMMASGEITGEDDVQGISGKMLMRVRQIRDMTDNLSGLMTLEQGNLKMQPEACLVPDMLDAVAAHYGQKCREAGIQLTIRRRSCQSVLADRPQIMRVFDNLIGNAIRYTPQGGTITVSAEDTTNEVRFSVRDTGSGISTEQQPYIFGRFYRGEQSRTGDGTNQGLGLSICYEIIKAHNGVIGVASEYGIGSEFYFTLRQTAEG